MPSKPSEIEKQSKSSLSSTESTLINRIIKVLAENNQSEILFSDKTAAAEKEIAAARQEASFWKQQFEALTALRESEPEARLSEIRKEIDDVNETTNFLVSQVQAMVSQKPSHAAKTGAETDNEGGPDNVLENLETKLSEKREIIQAYQRLTGVVLLIDSTSGDVDAEDDKECAATTTRLQCTAINHIHKRVVRFALTLPNENSGSSSSSSSSSSANGEGGVADALFTPMAKFRQQQQQQQQQNQANGEGGVADALFTPMANKQMLPSNMQEPATFEAQQLPVLFHRLLKKLYSDSAP
eukprot:CAMPEP_0171994448 /NCGR_PEP_ID=MMETSP0993-20121228/278953_1 /TAXON_ID=483369 /ORGANISM="non described non described, Strain CCMP2098" /LENGTH=297 /DNA_ID=CAMNT_0012647525 /DNA_START=72 /DNA_END=966 /DNA_ORIENTATION=+